MPMHPHHNNTTGRAYFAYSGSFIQYVLTMTTSVISMACLLLTLIVYSVIPELRNAHGRNLMAFSATLFLAQLMFLLNSGVVTSEICVALAVFLHFMWLSVFHWMTAMSYDLARTFYVGNMRIAMVYNWKVSFRRYSLFAWGVPLVVVAVCAGCDYAWSGTLIGYGHYDICWITNQRALLVVFGVPIAVLLLENGVMFAITVYGIETAKQLSKIARRRKQDKKHILIYLKLTSIMGFMWIIGFVASVANLDALWYVFIACNGLQGFFVCFSFVLTKRIMRSVRSMTSSEKLSESSGSHKVYVQSQ
jgi:G protein-coupled receptor Mth (Methuselah protein)